MLNNQEILDLFTDCSFEELTEDTFDDSILNCLETYKEYAYGATKLVLWFKELIGYVVKIPFCGCLVDDEDIEEDSAYWGMHFEEFIGADGDWDYCAREVELYAKAQENKVEDLFLQTSLIGYVKDYPIYIQPQGKTFYCVNHPVLSNDELHSSRRLCEEAKVSLDEHWINDAIQAYGLEKVKSFLNFLHENEIDDLHNNNLGYYNHKPVIIDYAGYHY